ncbi:unnamed protein product, partial [Onchocerca flexuosa]|uniref:Pept_C1 domain-containing protein n=1 Tax=Onchocerca flexuosa TaxID=387005 RepID=A0A183I5U9_9BILA
MEDNGKLQAMQKLEAEWIDYKTTLGTIFRHISTDQEFNMMNGLSLSNETYLREGKKIYVNLYRYDQNDPLPAAIDWRKKGRVTSIKSQGQCGSCYAFSAAAALEGYYKKTKGKLIDFSPQNIMDCSRNYGNKGCNGGSVHASFDYARDYGVVKDLKYPYVHTEQPCKRGKNKGIATVKGYVLVPQGDELALKHAVAKEGPVPAAVHSSLPDFKFYKSGIYSSNSCGQVDHAILIVGYGTDRTLGEYWIVKNSWGTDWGEEG